MDADTLLLTVISLLGGLICIGIVVVLHFLPTVSDYGVGDFSALFRISLHRDAGLAVRGCTCRSQDGH